MLQINSGKLFTNPDRIVLPQKAVLYTNYAAEAPLRTSAGILTPDGQVDGITRLVLTYESQLERDPNNAGFQLAAVDQSSYVADVAAVLAFGLDVVCAPTHDVVQRLTQGGAGTPAAAARRLIPRVFDATVEALQGDEDRVAELFCQLIGLPRTTFLPVIRAIRRIASAAERASDDPEIAYVMLVAGIEAVAQSFAARPISWDDYEESVRAAVDDALAAVDDSQANVVRAALLSTAHLKLKQKYVQFAREHLDASFFRSEADGRQGPARRSDVHALFGGAYDVRSGHVHALDELPQSMTTLASFGEVARADEGVAWSITGLHRATRHILRTFVGRQPQVDAEVYPYTAELPGVVTAQMAPQYWIWRAEGFDHRSVRQYLTAFWGQLVSRSEDAAVTDITPVLEKIETLVKGLTPEHRVPMLVLYALFHCSVAAPHRPAAQEFLDQYQTDFERPVMENVALHVYLGEPLPWPGQQVEAIYRAHVKRRHRKNALRLPDVMEVAVLLNIAEQKRGEGDLTAARERIAEAVEEMPGVAELRELELMSDAELRSVSLPWRPIVFPRR